MNSNYKIKLSKKAVKFIKKQEMKFQDKIMGHLMELSVNPYEVLDVKPYHGEGGDYRLKIGNIRVVYDIYDDILLISVVKIGYRGDVYK